MKVLHTKLQILTPNKLEFPLASWYRRALSRCKTREWGGRECTAQLIVMISGLFQRGNLRVRLYLSVLSGHRGFSHRSRAGKVAVTEPCLSGYFARFCVVFLGGSLPLPVPLFCSILKTCCANAQCHKQCQLARSNVSIFICLFA